MELLKAKGITSQSGKITYITYLRALCTFYLRIHTGIKDPDIFPVFS